MSFLPSPPARPRRGRLLIEALLALTLAALASLAMAGVAGSALAMGDAAMQFDQAAQQAALGAAEALRAPCRLNAATTQTMWGRRHQTTRTTLVGAVAGARVDDRWQTVGLGRHDSLHVAAHIGVRCD